VGDDVTPASSPTCGIDDARRLGDLLRVVSGRLRDAGVETARIDARLLIAESARVRAEDILLHPDEVIGTPEAEVLEELVRRRESREPMSHILGVKGFRTFDLSVSADVLTPRPETELLVEVAVAHFEDRGLTPDRILDLGTGSGCIILSLIDHFAAARGVAVDISEAALAVAKSNADALDMTDRVDFLAGRWFEALPMDESAFDLIVSNPPYIPTADIADLAPEVRDFEPILALDGGEDGLDPYREIIVGAKDRLRDGGLLALEIGIAQAELVSSLCRTAGFVEVSVADDLAGIPRVVSALKVS